MNQSPSSAHVTITVNANNHRRAVMTKMRNTTKAKAAGYAFAALAASMALTGCAGFVMAPSTPLEANYVGVHGTAMGGQQPIVGAAVSVYAAGTTGYGSAATLLSSGTNTDSNGAFTVSYNCTYGTQIYFVARQGNPGGGTNPNEAMISAAGQCENINGLFINIDEVSTVGSVAALAPFMTGPANVGTSATNTAGLARAFASVTKLVNISTGRSGGSALPAGAVAPVAEINTLADAIAGCVNTTGGTAGDGSPCGKLFTDATVGANAPPTDTLTAAMNIAQHPTSNVGPICSLATVNSPFKPTLTCSSVKDWTMSVVYAPVSPNAYLGIYTPKTTTIDQSGQIWIANAAGTNGTVTILKQTGAVQSVTQVAYPLAIAIDKSGNGWVSTNASGSASIVELTSAGASTGTPITSGLSNPNALAFDGSGVLWVADNGNNSLTEFNTATGASIHSVSVSSPTFIAIDPK